MEIKKLNYKEFVGFINVLIKMLKEDVPREKIIEYLEELKNTK